MRKLLGIIAAASVAELALAGALLGVAGLGGWFSAWLDVAAALAPVALVLGGLGAALAFAAFPPGPERRIVLALGLAGVLASAALDRARAAQPRPDALGQRPGTPLKLLTFNIWDHNRQTGRTVDAILASPRSISWRCKGRQPDATRPPPPRARLSLLGPLPARLQHHPDLQAALDRQRPAGRRPNPQLRLVGHDHGAGWPAGADRLGPPGLAGPSGRPGPTARGAGALRGHPAQAGPAGDRRLQPDALDDRPTPAGRRPCPADPPHPRRLHPGPRRSPKSATRPPSPSFRSTRSTPARPGKPSPSADCRSPARTTTGCW